MTGLVCACVCHDENLCSFLFSCPCPMPPPLVRRLAVNDEGRRFPEPPSIGFRETRSTVLTCTAVVIVGHGRYLWRNLRPWRVAAERRGTVLRNAQCAVNRIRPDLSAFSLDKRVLLAVTPANSRRHEHSYAASATAKCQSTARETCRSAASRRHVDASFVCKKARGWKFRRREHRAPPFFVDWSF